MDHLQALNPHHQVCVKASAGTGKTWLLVNRLIRLLIEGVPHDHIIALTFTRKACTEMQQRVLHNLEELSRLAPDKRQLALQSLGLQANEPQLRRAALIYEQLLRSQNGLRITTFHAFCQELLKRFPFEAQIPPNFELLEETDSLIEESLDNLLALCNQDPDSPVALHLQALYTQCNGLYMSKGLIKTFIEHRSDWWAYTQQQDKQLEFSLNNLAKTIKPPAEPPVLRDPQLVKQLWEYHDLLSRHPNRTTDQWRENIETALEVFTEEQALELIHSCFFTQQGTVRKITKAMEKAIGESHLARFNLLFEEIPKRLDHFRNAVNKQKYYSLCHSWYVVGMEALERYQTLKLERRLLDFSDLEWQAYRLLNKNHYALWIQYQLDAKFDHILIDEFQDTNPTQWQLILPLLQEITSQRSNKSLFIVGDEKQSIYGFRRADAQLFGFAQTFIEQAQGIVLEQHLSRRSSKEIIDFLNMVFTGNKTLLPEFHQHSSFHQDQWGCVEVHLAFSNEEIAPSDDFRNPLIQARHKETRTAHQQEAEYVADKIHNILQQGLLIQDGETTRPAQASDIMILLRKRKHIGHYQRALQSHNIPYTSNNKGTLFENQEILDIINLLSFIVAPHNNLALASILKSPLFACNEEDLLRLLKSDKHGSWFERLKNFAGPEEDPLNRAYHLLAEWMGLADHVPIHDLLDHILFQCDVRRRYEYSYPRHIVFRIRSSIAKLLDLSLQINNGRYPSISRFLENMERLRSMDTPDEEIISHQSDRVQILTIHSAKGLEAPIVFLADAASSSTHHESKAWIHWPAGESRPLGFLLENSLSRCIEELQDLDVVKRQKELKEDANLFYVALSRARQALFISGSIAKRNTGDSWYHRLNNVCPLDDENPVYRLQYRKPSYAETPLDKKTLDTMEIIPAIDVASEGNQITPSQSSQADSPEQNRQAKLRGNIIHRMIQLLNEGYQKNQILSLANQEFVYIPKDLDNLFQSSYKIVNDERFAFLFNAQQYDRAWNELPISFKEGGVSVNGIIDRLVLCQQTLYIVDYKSGEIPPDDSSLMEKYRRQLRYYIQGLDKLWPKKEKQAFLLFTDQGKKERII